METMKISRKRLEENLFELGKIGRNNIGGIDRALGSESDRRARKWLMEYWQQSLGLSTRLDAIANMWVRYEGTESLPPIVIGSHHDTVPNGGMYDGALGVLGATEIVQTLKERDIKTRHPIEIVSFTGEEPNPYNVSTLGSKVLSGRLVKEDLEKLTSYIDGSSLAECIRAVGGDISKAEEARLKENDVRAFIELHIEQGKRLYEKGITSAAVNCITGIYRENIMVIGEANHAGTTIMNDRHDALLAASEFALLYEQLVRAEDREDVVGTIGYVKVFPNAASIVPGSVELILELRCCDEMIRQRIREGIATAAKTVEEKRGVSINRKLNLDQKEMPMERVVIDAIKQGIMEVEIKKEHEQAEKDVYPDKNPVEKRLDGQEKNIEPLELVSMAGHDAANMQRVTKSAMIFVQSINGKSHCPEEDTDIYCIEETVNAMLQAVLILDKEMDV